MKTSYHWLTRGVFIAAFIAINLLYNVDYLLFVKPQSLHIWRQTNCLTITQCYYQDHVSFFEPEMQSWYGNDGTSGKAAGELPVIYYLVAKLWQLFGKHEWIFRLVQLLIIGIGLLLLFEILNYFLKDPWQSGIVSLLLFTSPMNVFFGLNFLPDTPSVALILIAWYFLFRYYLFRRSYLLWFAALFFFIGIGIKVTSALSFIAFGGWILLEYVLIKPEKRVFNLRISQLAPFVLAALLVVAWYLYAGYYNRINHGGYTALGILPIWNMSHERLLQVLDAIHKLLLGEFFSPVLQAISVVAWAFLMFNIKKLSLFLRYILVVFPLGFLGYLILWFDVLDGHDYYFITSTIVMVPVWAIFFYYLKGVKIKYFQIIINIVLILAMVANVFFCKKRLDDRHVGWKNEWFKEKLEAVGELEPFLDKWGVEKGNLVISIPDYSINGTLYLMNRKGYTDYASDFSKEETFIRRIGQGARYLVVNDTTILHRPEIQPFATHLIGQYRNVKVFDLRPFINPESLGE